MLINNIEQLIGIITMAQRICVFGAGLCARVVVRYLVENGLHHKLYCITVTSMEGNPSDILGVPVIPLYQLSQSDTDAIIVATFQNLHESIMATLSDNSFTDVFLLGGK